MFLAASVAGRGVLGGAFRLEAQGDPSLTAF